MRILVETKFGVIPLPIEIAALSRENQDLLEKNLEDAFQFLAKDKEQKEIEVAEFVSIMNVATDKFLEGLRKKEQRRSGPILLVPDYVAKEKAPR